MGQVETANIDQTLEKFANKGVEKSQDPERTVGSREDFVVVTSVVL